MEKHQPVLLEKVIELLRPQPGEIFVDFTAGYGGHTSQLLDSVGETGFGYAFDQDSNAIAALRTRFATIPNIVIKQTNFAQLNYKTDIPMANRMLADLGVSSPQIDDPLRGFSFQTDGPLDMRMNQDNEVSAREIVNSYSESDLADIFYEYGEERKSRKVAKAIVEARSVRAIETTAELATIVTAVIPYAGKIHPATRVFQALRIEVNNELQALQTLLSAVPNKLLPGGRIAIISFHSLEDRIVKHSFKALCSPQKDEFGQTIVEPQFRLVTKKPVMGSEYDLQNPRARSAKLRVVEKINLKQK